MVIEKINSKKCIKEDLKAKLNLLFPSDVLIENKLQK